LGIGDWGLGPIPNPQSPIPKIIIIFIINLANINLVIINFIRSILNIKLNYIS